MWVAASAKSWWAGGGEAGFAAGQVDGDDIDLAGEEAAPAVEGGRAGAGRGQAEEADGGLRDEVAGV